MPKLTHSYAPSVESLNLKRVCQIEESLEIDEYKLLEESMKKGVSFVPGRLMGSKNGYVRFTYGKGNGASIQEGISRFVYALRSYRG